MALSSGINFIDSMPIPILKNEMIVIVRTKFPITSRNSRTIKPQKKIDPESLRFKSVHLLPFPMMNFSNKSNCMKFIVKFFRNNFHDFPTHASWRCFHSMRRIGNVRANCVGALAKKRRIFLIQVFSADKKVSQFKVLSGFTFESSEEVQKNKNNSKF